MWAIDCPIKFRDMTVESGVDFVHTHGGSGRKYIVETVSAGLALFDYDNDGKAEIYFLNGRPLAGTRTRERPRNRLYRNLDGFHFQDVTDQAGVDGGTGYGLGVCAGDYDNDGRMDVVVLNSNDRPTLLRNESETGNHWLQVRLRGVASNRDGVGARVYAAAGDLRQMDEVHSGRGYQCHWGMRLHFGLGKHDRAKRIEVHWPRSGVVDILEDVRVDRLLTIVEGSAPSKEKPLFTYPVRGKKQNRKNPVLTYPVNTRN